MIYALSLASNLDAKKHILWAVEQLSYAGKLRLSEFFEIPCRDGVGNKYLNGACLLYSSNHSKSELLDLIKQLEYQTGRVRPSHSITLDIDLIAWQSVNSTWYFNKKKWPLAFDVKLPLSQLIQHPDLAIHSHEAIGCCIKYTLPTHYTI